MHQERNPTTVSQLLTQIQGLQNKVISLSDAREIYDPESGSSSGATHVPSQPSTIPIPRTMPRYDSGLLHDTRNYTGTSGNVFERPPAQEGRPSTFFYNSKNSAQRRDHFQSGSGMLKDSGGTCSHSDMIDYPRFPISELHLGKFSCHCGITKLESQLQDWSKFKDSRSSSHNALDQRSCDSKVNWRTYDIAIDCRANCCTRVRYAWCDDCVSIEKTSRQARSVLRILTDSYVGDKLLSWSASISVQAELMKRYKDSQICSV